jgi:hypothetical protein
MSLNRTHPRNKFAKIAPIQSGSHHQRLENKQRRRDNHPPHIRYSSIFGCFDSTIEQCRS